MKEKILIFTLVGVIGLMFALMFISVQRTEMLMVQLVQQQAEALDLLRNSNKGGPSLKDTLADVQNKVKVVYDKLRAIPSPSQAKRPQPPQEDFNTVHQIPVGKAAVKGNTDAPVTIVGFLDLQCPFSKRFQPVIDQVLKAYPEKVKYVVKHFPLSFHKQAIPAAKAVLAAGEQGKFFEMMEMVLQNNKDLSAAKYEEFAKELKLNIKKFKKAVESNDQAWTKLIQEDFVLGQKVGVRGTPTYYLNGKKTRARDLASFKAEIDGILNAKE